MADILKKYKNKSGYTIKATEKAYNIFYKKQGFVPVDDSNEKDPAASNPDEKDPAASNPDEQDPDAGDSVPKEPAKKSKGKNTKAADKDATEPEAPADATQEE